MLLEILLIALCFNLYHFLYSFGSLNLKSADKSINLLLFDPELKSTLKKEKLTTRDSRAVERKKYGHRKARRSFQFSKR